MLRNEGFRKIGLQRERFSDAKNPWAPGILPSQQQNVHERLLRSGIGTGASFDGIGA